MKFQNANVLITGGASVIGLYHAMDNFTGRKPADTSASKAL